MEIWDNAHIWNWTSCNRSRHPVISVPFLYCFCSLLFHLFSSSLVYLLNTDSDWKLVVVIIPTLSPLVAPEVVVTTTSGAIVDDKVGTLTTLRFQSIDLSLQFRCRAYTLSLVAVSYCLAAAVLSGSQCSYGGKRGSWQRHRRELHQRAGLPLARSMAQ